MMSTDAKGKLLPVLGLRRNSQPSERAENDISYLMQLNSRLLAVLEEEDGLEREQLAQEAANARDVPATPEADIEAVGAQQVARQRRSRQEEQPEDEIQVIPREPDTARPQAEGVASPAAPILEEGPLPENALTVSNKVTGIEFSRRDPYAWWERLQFVEGMAGRDDREFIQALRTKHEFGDDKKSVLDLLLDSEEKLAKALEPNGLTGADRANAVRIQSVNMRWIATQKSLLERLNGTTNMGAAEKALNLLHAAILTSVPFLTGAIPTPKNGAYLAAATAALVKYNHQMLALLRLGTIDSATVTDALVSRHYTWAANAGFLLVPTALGADKLIDNLGFSVGAAAFDFGSLFLLERRAKYWEKLRHSGDEAVRAGKIGLPDAAHRQVDSALKELSAGLEAIKSLRKKFEDSNLRVTGGLSAQISRLMTDQAALEKMLRASLDAAVAQTGPADLEAGDAVEGGAAADTQAVGFTRWIAEQKRQTERITDIKRKAVLVAMSALIQVFQVITTSKNATLLPDYLAYLFVVESAMLRSALNPANTYQDVERTFLDYNAGSVIGVPFNIANYVQPETFKDGTVNPNSQLGIGPHHVTGFVLWTLYVSLMGMTVSPFIGQWLAAALDIAFGGITTAFAAAKQAFEAARPEAELALPARTRPDFEDDVASAPAEELVLMGNLRKLDPSAAAALPV
jgi:hypothetical protein